VLGSLDDSGDVLVGAGRFFRDTTRRATPHENASPSEVIDHLPPPKLLDGGMSAQAPSCTVTRRSERTSTTFRSANEDVRSSSHRPPNQHRLTDGTKAFW
jgi:hypothetical protein